jgi:hypothetical protein
MSRTVWRLVIASTSALSLAADDPKPRPKLDVPKGWRTEDTTYPPPWAKSLPWKGRLEIRFPPGWFQAQSDEFWSYPVLYTLDGDVLAKRDDLEKALRAYDAGLYDGKFEASRIQIKIGDDRKTETRGHAVVRRSVTVDGYDPLVTRAPLKTNLEVFRWYCPKTRATSVLILRSPRPLKEDDPVWSQLLKFWDHVDCHGSP